MTTRESLLRAIQNLRVYSRGQARAPNKPLLILLALARVDKKSDRWIQFREIEEPLTQLLRDFGPPRKTDKVGPNYPFWYLQNDKFWEVREPQVLVPRKGKWDRGEPSTKELRDKNAQGGFTDAVYHLLVKDEALRREIVQMLLTRAFPESLHEDILTAVGLSLEGDLLNQAGERDHRFRDTVLQAYDCRCAVCGYDGSVGRRPVAVEAAHIRWVQYAGPNVVTNGICMCSLHHKLFDTGGFTILPEGFRVIYSSAFGGRSPIFDTLLLAHQRALIVIPRDRKALPGKDFLAWHYRQVFRPPPLDPL